MSLMHKVAIVTGAGSGIGAAIAKKFVEEGAKVTMVDLNQTKLTNVAQKIEQKSTKPVVITGDVTIKEDCRRMFDETLKNFGKLDILVNNAGIGGGVSITDENTMEEFDKVMRTNLRSAVFMTHLAVPYLVKTKGNIINMSSIVGRATFPFLQYPYGISKAGLDYFTKATALELSSQGVRVNAINPGPVHSDVTDSLGLTGKEKEAFLDMVTKITTLGKFADAEEIGDLAVFLASDKARSMTGGTYICDNGCLLKGYSG